MQSDVYAYSVHTPLFNQTYSFEIEKGRGKKGLINDRDKAIVMNTLSLYHAHPGVLFFRLKITSNNSIMIVISTNHLLSIFSKAQ